VKAANRGNARSQSELGKFHFLSATRLDTLQGAPADNVVVTARWAETLRLAAEQGFTAAQTRCGLIYAIGGRSVPQNWATAVKWWQKAAEAGQATAQWNIGVCYYYGRGADRDVTQAMAWIRNSAAQGHPAAVKAVQSGIPGQGGIREDIVRFTNAGSAPPRHAAAHNFADTVHEHYLRATLKVCNDSLQESDSSVPRAAPVYA
jgi:TPR repeat protein